MNGPTSSASRCPWHRPHTSAARAGESRAGFTIVGIGRLARPEPQPPQRIRVRRDVRRARPVARLARDPELRRRRVEPPRRRVEPRVRRDVVTEDAVVVPPRDVPIEHAATEHRPPGRVDARVVREQERPRHREPPLLLDVPRDRQPPVRVALLREVLLIAMRPDRARDRHGARRATVRRERHAKRAARIRAHPSARRRRRAATSPRRTPRARSPASPPPSSSDETSAASSGDCPRDTARTRPTRRTPRREGRAASRDPSRSERCFTNVAPARTTMAPSGSDAAIHVERRILRRTTPSSSSHVARGGAFRAYMRLFASARPLLALGFAGSSLSASS